MIPKYSINLPLAGLILLTSRFIYVLAYRRRFKALNGTLLHIQGGVPYLSEDVESRS